MEWAVGEARARVRERVADLLSDLHRRVVQDDRDLARRRRDTPRGERPGGTKGERLRGEGVAVGGDPQAVGAQGLVEGRLPPGAVAAVLVDRPQHGEAEVRVDGLPETGRGPALDLDEGAVERAVEATNAAVPAEAWAAEPPADRAGLAGDGGARGAERERRGAGAAPLRGS